MDFLSNFVETLAELKLIHNLKTKELAEEINIDSTSITKYFTVGVIPKLPYAIAIADYFGCSLDYLFGLTNDYKKKAYSSCPPFCKAFQYMLKRHNITRYKFAKDTEFSYQSVTAWYHGDSIPTMGNIIKIAEYFNCTLDELVRRKAVE